MPHILFSPGRDWSGVWLRFVDARRIAVPNLPWSGPPSNQTNRSNIKWNGSMWFSMGSYCRSPKPRGSYKFVYTKNFWCSRGRLWGSNIWVGPVGVFKAHSGYVYIYYIANNFCPSLLSLCVCRWVVLCNMIISELLSCRSLKMNICSLDWLADADNYALSNNDKNANKWVAMAPFGLGVLRFETSMCWFFCLTGSGGPGAQK